MTALKRARDQDLAVHPGQDIEYVVVDDAKTSRERVALAHEKVETYDPDYYETDSSEPSRAFSHRWAGHGRNIRRELSGTRVPELTAFTESKEN